MMENTYNPVVTKDELIDILYQKNNEGEKFGITDKEVTKEDISNSIDKVINLEKENNRIYSFNFLNGIESLAGKKLSLNFTNVYFFKVDNNKYIYIYANVFLDSPDMEEDFVRQIDYIINNNLNEGKMSDNLELLKNQYAKSKEYFEQGQKTSEDIFKEYDYIKIINDNHHYSDIGVKDIIMCMSFLGYNQKHRFLTIDEQIILRMIILYGVINIYYNNTDYYKEMYEDIINTNMEEINNYILFIKENMDKVENNDRYSFNKDSGLNLHNFLYNKGLDASFYRKIKNRSLNKLATDNLNELITVLRFISFDYFVSNNRFDDAKKIYEMDFPFYKNYENIGFNSEVMVLTVLTDTDSASIRGLAENDVSYDFVKKLNINHSTRRNIKVMLKYYINCYYYFRHFKEFENANNVYDFLLYFKDGYGIDDFIIKCKYFKISEDIYGLKSDNTDIEELDKAIESMITKIDDMKLIDSFDINDVEKEYPHIIFDNFDEKEKVKTYIATGDKIIKTFDNDQNAEFDYSSAVIEWCKAVELGMNEKFFSRITQKNKYKIQEYSKTKNPYAKNDFKLSNKGDTTIGIFKAIRDYNLQEYLFTEIFSSIYTFNQETYDELCGYMIDISEPRNNSAHKGDSINIVTARECKDKILKANKILEILSKLKEK